MTSDERNYDTCLRKGRRLEAVSGLPDNVTRFRRVIVSRETGSTQPTRPARSSSRATST